MKRLLCAVFGHRPNYSHPSMWIDWVGGLGRVTYSYRCDRCQEIALRTDRLVVAL